MTDRPADRLLRALRDPRTLPSKVRRRVDRLLNDSVGTRVVWPQPGRALLERFEVPRPHGHQVLVLTHTTVVSPGTERAMFAGLPNTSVEYPAYPGYSGSGDVILDGPDAVGLAPGTRVAGPFQHASLQVLDDSQLVTVPSSVTLDEAAFLQLGVIALQGVRRGRIAFGDRVAVLGSGPLGLLAGQFARTAGARRVVVVGGTTSRLAIASTLGLEAIDRRTFAGARFAADITLDVTGNPAAIVDAVHATRPGGRIVLLGSNRGVTPGFDVSELRRKGLELVGAHIMGLPARDRAPGSWPWRDEAALVLELIAQRRLAVKPLLSHDVNPAEVERLYRGLSGEGGAVLGAALRWDQLDRPRRYRPGREIARERLRRASVRTPAPTIAAPAPSSSPPAAPDRRLGIALIGCGEIAIDNARAIAASPAAELRLAMDIDPALARDMGRRHGVEAVSSVDAVWDADGIEAVVISVPHHLHAPLTIEAAKHGKHVIVEKPMATTVDEAEAMIDACRRAGVNLGVCYANRYLPYVQRARSLIERGALGRLLGVHLVHLLDKPPSYWSRGRTGRVTSDWRRAWATSGGGVLVFNLVHYLDLIHYLTGLTITEAFGIHATADSPTETEDTISACLRLGDDVVANVVGASCVRGATQQHQQLRIWGTEGHLNVAEPLQVYSLHEVDGLLPGAWHDLGEWEWGIERREYVTAFARAVFEKRRPDVGGEEGLAVQKVVEAIYASQRTGRPQRVGELEHV